MGAELIGYAGGADGFRSYAIGRRRGSHRFGGRGNVRRARRFSHSGGGKKGRRPHHARDA